MAETLKTSHHHGDLRRALIAAGITILEEDGPTGLTLRKCAARAGVSHAAPAHHFDGVADLRRAIATEGFTRFTAYMRAARADGSQDPRGRLRSICLGYVRFARDHPALYALIFSAEALQGFAKSKVNDDGAYALLAETCAPFVAPAQDPAIVETQVWSLIHGYAQLYLGGRFGPSDSVVGPVEDVLTLLDALPLAVS